MISEEIIEYLKQYGKFAAIFIVVFVLLKFTANMRVFEAIILALIVGIAIMIIENIIYLNNKITDPLNCEQCKITSDTDTQTNQVNQASNSENKQTENKETENKQVENENKMEKFTSDNKNEVVEHYGTETLKALLNNIGKLLDKAEDKLDKSVCNSELLKMEGFTNVEENVPAILNVKNSNTTNSNRNNNVSNSNINNSVNNVNSNRNISNENNQEIINNLSGINAETEQVIENGLPSAEVNAVFKSGPIDYSDNYVDYQTNGSQAEQDKKSLETNLFNYNEGDKRLTNQYLNDGKVYYDKIFTRSSNAPKKFESLENELQYGDFNYLGPLNRGMANREYTYISPDNWRAVGPHPPVCVTNKRCTTCPVQISTGQDYMNFASLEDFDQARRFTGNMGINIEYVRDILNNDNGY